jgi:NPCBM/NEW2 domain/Hydrazine synthase alpha subunit middle domain
MAVFAGGNAASQPSDQYLSDCFDELVLGHTQGWGKLGLNTAAQPTDGRAPGVLRIGETVYEKGLGHHAPGEIVVGLPGGYTAFSAEVGVHWQGGNRGSVVFEVYVDGEKRFDSGKMTDSDPPKSVSVPVHGAAELRLVATDAGDGFSCDMAQWANARLSRDPSSPYFGRPVMVLAGEPAPSPSAESCGFALVAHDEGPQVAALGPDAFVVSLQAGEDMAVTIPARNIKEAVRVTVEAALLGGSGAEVSLTVDDAPPLWRTLSGGMEQFEIARQAGGEDMAAHLRVRAAGAESLVRLGKARLFTGDSAFDLPLSPNVPRLGQFPPRALPALRPAMAQALIEWDWRMQDGIGTEREPQTYAVAVERTLGRGDALFADLREAGVKLDAEAAQWEALRAGWQELSAAGAGDDDPRWEELWLRVHHLRRDLVFANPLADLGPLAFVKRVPSAFSHQLTQYYGRSARPGGGVYVLEQPGKTMACRELVSSSQLPQGSYMLPEVSYDAGRILFAYCEVPSVPTRATKQECLDRHYHLFEVRPDGTGLRQMTEGPFDDFAPRELPSGELMFLSTRRGGYHRCGAGPCAVYTLAMAETDGSNPRTVSYHETQEWDPSILGDGRVIYTRWDYVDRNAVHYQQLWTVRPDGSAPMAYYGNNTFNPVGVWEARQVPDSPLIMATAAAHHAMTAGSIILLDTTMGVDGLEPITRLTPDAPFPESETHVLPRNWHAPGSPKEYDTPEEQKRWPGHCYRSPYPLSDKYFLASYSYDPLIGEPDGNKPNMFGLYLVDAFGNRELLYRDLNVASQWPLPLRPRKKPPVLPSLGGANVAKEGTFFLQDVYASDPSLPKESVKQLRIVQVLPKTTPNANQPTVGFANASPGKQVLGTVPVEPDGSAYFRAPAGIPLCFQALDERGQAVQIMRSITYLQPGEQASCVGCHEHRLTAPPHAPKAMAMMQPASPITPAPDGSNPLSYPLLVQPVLDKHCVKCHAGEKPAGPEGCPIVLTGEPEGAYSKSYNVLGKRVPYSSWGGLEANGEPITQPDRFGARASTLMAMLQKGHHKVALGDDDMDRLTTWMDSNALFYGTFKPEDQARQLRGERIEGPELE